MGLAADPGLSRARPAIVDGSDSGLADVGRSISCDGLRPCPDLSLVVAEAVFARSKSEGSIDHNPIHRQQPFRPPLLFGAVIPNKPPLGRRPWLAAVEHRESGSVGGGDCDDWRCTFKNLDDGREFMVKEFWEDGMWDKLREVGTGRQLTIEEFEMCVGRSPIVQELMRRQNMEELGDEDEPNYQ